MEDIAQVALDYFEKLFNAGLCDQMDECLKVVPCKATFDMHNILSSEFNAEEIKLALFQMDPTEAPGPEINPI